MSIQGFVVRVGRKLNRSPQDVQPFVDLLQDNWYDSPDTLVDVSGDDLAKLGLPLRFAKELISAASEQGSKGGRGGSNHDRGEERKGRDKGKDKGREKGDKGRDKGDKGDKGDRSSKGKGKDSGKDKGKGKEDKGKGKSKDKGSKGGKSKDKETRYSGGRDKSEAPDSDNEFQEAISLEDAAAMRPEFGLRQKILGEKGRNVKHIEAATGTRVSLEGGPTEDGDDTGEPMQLIVSGNDEKEYNRALDMLHDLLDTIFEDYNVWAAKKGYETFEVAEEAEESHGKSEGRKGGKGKGKKGKGKGESKGKGRSGEPPHKRARN